MCAESNAGVTSDVVVEVLALLSGLSFLYDGFKILFRSASTGEFERYGMPAVRQVVGVLDVLGGTAVSSAWPSHHWEPSLLPGSLR